MLEWGFAQVDQQWFNTPALLADAERMYAEVKPLQPKYWRIGAAWPLIAKTRDPGTFIAGTPPTSTGRDWSTLDTSLNEGLLLGCDIVLILGVRKASWGGFQFGPFSFGATVGTAADFGAFCAEVATRYKVGGPGIRTDGRYAPNSGKGVHIFEIWNEQNDQNHWGGQISAQDYTNFLIAGYDAIKAVSGLSGTNSRILFGGTYHVQRQPPWWGYGIASLPEVEFLTQCYTYGAKDKFDAMNIHLYTNLDDLSFNGSDLGPAPTMNLDNMRQLVDIRALMVSKGDGAKKISITEAGFPVSVVGEALQKTYWETLWGLLSALSYVDMVLFYCARDGGGAVDSINGSLGAMRADFSHKPVWAFLQTLSPPPSVTPGFSGAGTLTASVQRVVAAAFSGDGVFGATTPPRVMPAFSGSGELDAMADRNGERNAQFDGTGSLSASVTPSLSVTSSFTGLGSLTATTVPRLSVAAPFTGAGSLSSAAQVVGSGRAPQFNGEGTLSAVAVTPVLWNSTGAGGITATTASGGKSVSWSHNTTVTGSDVWVFVEVGVSTSGGTGAIAGVGLTYGPLSGADIFASKSTSGAYVFVFGLRNPPTGPQTVTVTTTPASGVTISSLQGTSVAFTNIGEVVTPAIGAAGTNATRSVTVAASTGSRALAVMAGSSAVVASWTLSHTQRYDGGGAVTGNGDTVIVQDGPGEDDGSVTLTATRTGLTETWTALGMVLNPVIPIPTAAPAFSGSGTLAASVAVTPTRTASLTGSGVLSAVGVVSFSRAAAFAGAGALSGAIGGSPTADFTGTGSLTAAMVPVLTVTAALTGTGTLSATGFEVYARAASLTGSGALAATGFQSYARTAALTGAGTLTAVRSGPIYDATGAGANLNNQSLSPRTITWSHTATAGAYVVVAVSAYQNGGLGIASITATYNGVSMTSLGTVNPNSSTYGKMALFGLASAPGGAQTVSVTATATSGAVTALTGGSTSYKGVSSVGTVTTGVGGSNTPSVSATGLTNGLVVAAFGANQTANGVATTGFNRTQRYLYDSVAGTDTPLILGDTAMTGALSFSATLSGPSSFWAGIAVVLT